MKSNNILPIPPYKGYFIDNCWYTRYKTGGSFEYHQHGHSQSIFSIIYILNDQNVGNSTIFMNHDRNYLSMSEDIGIDTADYSDIKEGTVIIFPSSFHHKVNRIKIPNRITVSYNIFGVL